MATRRIDPLRSDVPIADEKGNPSKFFQRQWNTQIAATGALPDIEAQVEQLETDVAALQDVEIVAGTGLDGGGVLGTDPTITLDLADTAVTPGTYGDATNVPQITVDQQGRITEVVDVPITGGGGGSGPGQQSGTFTPTITFSTPGDLSVAYTAQLGRYIQIGKLVFVNLRIVFTPTFTTASGQLRIAGLPVTSGDVGFSAGGSVLANISSATFPIGTTDVGLSALPLSTNLIIVANGSEVAQATIQASNITSGVSVTLVGSCVYEANTDLTGSGSTFGFNPPAASAFPTEVNGGTAAGSLTENTSLGLIIRQTAGGASDWHLRLQAGSPPMSGTRSYRAWLKFNAQFTASCVFGIILRNSSLNRHLANGFDQGYSGPIRRIAATYTSTAFNATISATNASTDDLWFRTDVTSAGAVNIFISADGSFWTNVASTTLAAYVGTYDQVGIGLRPGAGPLYCSGAVRAFEIVDF